MNDNNRSLTFTLRAFSGSGIWTGDATMGFSYIKATSLLGGLRFWTAALLRSLGRKVHEPSKECLKKESCCELCKIFGCTGSARTFLMQVEMKNFNPMAIIGKPKPLILKHASRESKYYFKTGFQNEFTVKFVPHLPGINLSSEMLAAFQLMVEYGTLGAQDQYGCGLVHFIPPETKIPFTLPLLTDSFTEKGNSSAVNLKDFFFFKVAVPKGKGQEAMANIRYDTREALRTGTNAVEIRHRFCGSMSNPKEVHGTMYNLAVDSEKNILYGWGWFPSYTPEDKNQRARALEALTNAIKKNYSLIDWKAFRKEEKSMKWDDYLRTLLTKNWRE